MPRLARKVTLAPACLSTSAYMLATISCSSKLVEPIVMFGPEAWAVGAGVDDELHAAASTAITMPVSRTRVLRMVPPWGNKSDCFNRCDRLEATLSGVAVSWCEEVSPP